MTARRSRRKAKLRRETETDPASERLDFARLLRETGDLAENEEDQEMVEALAEIAETDPEAIAHIYHELDDWRESFVAKHGREPQDEDLEALLNEIFSNVKDGELDDEDDHPDALQRCAWCRTEIEDNQEVFGFGVRLGGMKLLDADTGEMIEFPIPHRSKVAEAAVVAEDSAAKQDGWDLLFMACSQACAEELQTAIDEAQDIAQTDMLN